MGAKPGETRMRTDILRSLAVDTACSYVTPSVICHSKQGNVNKAEKVCREDAGVTRCASLESRLLRSWNKRWTDITPILQ